MAGQRAAELHVGKMARAFSAVGTPPATRRDAASRDAARDETRSIDDGEMRRVCCIMREGIIGIVQFSTDTV